LHPVRIRQRPPSQTAPSQTPMGGTARSERRNGEVSSSNGETGSVRGVFFYIFYGCKESGMPCQNSLCGLILEHGDERRTVGGRGSPGASSVGVGGEAFLCQECVQSSWVKWGRAFNVCATCKFVYLSGRFNVAKTVLYVVGKGVQCL